MANVQYFDVILKPVITEKSMNAMSEKKYTFLVHPEANKSMIKKRNDLRQDRKNQEGYCEADRGQQGDRGIPGPVSTGIQPIRQFEP